MKKVILLLALFLSFSGKAQTYFNKLDSMGFWNSSVTYTESLLTGNYIYTTSGTAWHEDFSSLLLKRYDFSGNLLNIDTISESPNVTTAGKLVKLDNGFLLAYELNSHYSLYNYDSIDVVLRRYDRDYNLHFQKRLGGLGFDYLENVIVCEDKGFAITGYSSSYGDSMGDMYIIKTDSLGSIEWEANYGSPNHTEVAYSICQTTDGGFVLAGYTTGVPILPFYFNRDFYLIKTDSLGHVIWTKTFASQNDDGAIYVNQLEDGNLLFDGYFELDHTDSYNYRTMILKMDLAGTIISQDSIQIGPSTIFYSRMTKNSRSNYNVIGALNNSNSYQIATMFEFDVNGNLLMHKTYDLNPSRDEYFSAFIETESGKNILAGCAFDSILTQSAWLLTTDCHGCDSLSCYYPDSSCATFDCEQFTLDANFWLSDSTINFASNEFNVTLAYIDSLDLNYYWDFNHDSILYNQSIVNIPFTQTGTYIISLIVFNGMCSDTVVQTIEVVDVLGLDENLSSPSIPLQRGKLYPNPSNGSFTVENNSGVALEFEVYDALGKVVFRKLISDKTEQLELNLENGVYVAQFSYKGLNYQEKLVVRK